MNIREAIKEAKRLKQERVNQQNERTPIHPSKGAYIDKTGTLVIPFDCHPEYHWWAGGQTISGTLVDLRVPEEVWKKYTNKRYPEEIN